MEQNSTPFESHWFDNAPFAMLLQDAHGRVQWANHALEEVAGLPASQFLGHDEGSLPSPAHRVLLGEDELVRLEGPNTPQRWLIRRVHAGSNSSQRLHVFQDVTREQVLEQENNRLRRQIADLKLTDDLTGLPNRRAVSQALEAQISRSRRYRNPLSVILVTVALQGNLEALGDSADNAYLVVSRFLRDRLRWVDQIGRWDNNVFLLVLPETGEDDARGLIQKIQTESASLALPAPFESTSVQLTTGLGCWDKGHDMRTLLQLVLDDLKNNT